MSPVVQRLTGERNFRSVYRHGRRWRGQTLNLSWLPAPVASTRVAVVVSKKVSAHAYERNLVKRRLWAGVRAHRRQLPAQGYYLVITAQPAARGRTYAELTQEFASLITRLTVKKAP